MTDKEIKSEIATRTKEHNKLRHKIILFTSEHPIGHKLMGAAYAIPEVYEHNYDFDSSEILQTVKSSIPKVAKFSHILDCILQCSWYPFCLMF